MEVHINDVVTSVHAVDGDALVSPRKMDELLQAFLRAADQRDAHRRNVLAERRITCGVAAEQAEEG
jgi:hypothetical protein